MWMKILNSVQKNKKKREKLISDKCFDEVLERKKG